MKTGWLLLTPALIVNCVDPAFLPDDSDATAPSAESEDSAFLANDKADSALHPLESRLRNEEQLITESISLLTANMRRLHAGRGTMRHGLHAKSHGCIKGTMTMNPDRASKTRHGLFATDTTYDVWTRFSSAQPKVLADAAPDARGLAIKVTGVPGRRLIADNASTQDFILFTHPVGLGADMRAIPDVLKTLANPAHAAILVLKHPEVVANTAVAFAAGALVANPLETRYWSAAPYRLGSTAVKYFVKPCAWTVDGPVWPLSINIPNILAADYLRDAMRATLASQGACFDFMVQFYANQRTTPIENHLKNWTTSVAPFHKVATINFPPQDFDKPEQHTFCENLSFNPWRGVEDHRPLGNLNRARKRVYEAVADLRRSTNRAPKTEPTGREVF